jgi:hypothetical protein
VEAHTSDREEASQRRQARRQPADTLREEQDAYAVASEGVLSSPPARIQLERQAAKARQDASATPRAQFREGADSEERRYRRDRDSQLLGDDPGREDHRAVTLQHQKAVSGVHAKSTWQLACRTFGRPDASQIVEVKNASRGKQTDAPTEAC